MIRRNTAYYLTDRTSTNVPADRLRDVPVLWRLRCPRYRLLHTNRIVSFIVGFAIYTPPAEYSLLCGKRLYVFEDLSRMESRIDVVIDFADLSVFVYEICFPEGSFVFYP